mmetsp:Transcript_28036/g.26896  ORF Transcript_28036/g.26896 Transcript_28036/m.26896 type:complete len:157 (+) Transcript_28036:46-516(+)
MRGSFALVIAIVILGYCSAFSLKTNRQRYTIKLNEGKLAEDEERNKGYGAFGSLTRQGPVPFFIRLSNPQTYEEAVNKYMVLEKCDRRTAQGNMDAYFQDPNGWAGNKLRARKSGKPDIDYANVNQSPKDLGLTAVWAIGIVSLFWRVLQVQVLDK